MDFHYEIKNQKLKKLIEEKAVKLGITVNQLIWNYVNRGLMGDECNEDVFEELHSEKFLKDVNEALGLEPWSEE